MPHPSQFDHREPERVFNLDDLPLPLKMKPWHHPFNMTYRLLEEAKDFDTLLTPEHDDILANDEDEQRLLAAYRRFKRRSPPGAVFSWESPPADEGTLIFPCDPSLIIDPRDRS